MNKTDVSILYGTESDLKDPLGWYVPGQTSYVLRTKYHMQGLAQLVNGTTGKTNAELGITGDGVEESHLADPMPFDGVSFHLGNNIALTGEWTPIGLYVSEEYCPHFAGRFMGDGYTVSGLSIGTAERPAQNGYQGLFGYVKSTSSEPVFSDLTVTGSV